MAGILGNKVYNFSRGGMSAKEFVESYATQCGAYSYEKLCQAYIIALGVNDSRVFEIGVGDRAVQEEPSADNQSFLVYYARIIKTLKTKQPKAKIFLMTMPYETHLEQEMQAKMVMSYIDWIVRNNPDDFAEAVLISTPYSYS